jgi:ABC-type branched-subunit amino acid transport system substrate-binding protein
MAGRRLPRGALVALLFGAAALGLSSFAAVPKYTKKTQTISQQIDPTGNPAEPGAVTPGAPGGPVVAAGGKTATVAGASVAKPGQACAAGRNGGSTSTGVSATSIELGATVVRSGIGSAFLGGAPTAMQAMVNKVNRDGGICGRLLHLKMVDDGWDATKGVTYLRSLIDQGVFALAVSPSSEGVDALIRAGDIKQKGVPLVGSDGLVKSQYGDPWVWPVASSTVSTMHLMAQEAYKRGARTFGIVFENDYKFGVEGALAFNASVKRLTGHDIPGFNSSLSTCNGTFCSIQSGQASYAPSVQKFNSACDTPNGASGFNPQPNPASGSLPSCDYVALLLEPKTALTWLTKDGGAAPHDRTMGPQPLFSEDFAKQCDHSCNGMEVWTSYNPPLDPYKSTPGIGAYVNTVRALDPSLDTANSFTEGAYIGINVLVQALQRVGPNLTRAGLQAALNSGAYDVGLGPPLSWRPGNHLGTGNMLSYKLQYQGQTFIAFTPNSPYVSDSSLGQDL